MAAHEFPDRRSFLGLTVSTVAARVCRGSALDAAQGAGRLGLYKVLGKDPAADLAQVHDLGFEVCEIYNDNFDAEFGKSLKDAIGRFGIRVAAMFSMGPGEMVWDFTRGPATIGLVPRALRLERIDHLKRASDFAQGLGIPAVETHCGFIPEDPACALYDETVNAVREAAAHCKANGQAFLYHAGQETPVTLLRIIEDVGLDNQGVGLDTANLIMYGKGHPTQALETIGRYLRLVNAKDGTYPANARQLGQEVPIGEGRVGFPEFLRKLRQIGYQGPVLIEREISGPKLLEDVRRSKVYLTKLMRAEGLL